MITSNRKKGGLPRQKKQRKKKLGQVEWKKRKTEERERERLAERRTEEGKGARERGIKSSVRRICRYNADRVGIVSKGKEKRERGKTEQPGGSSERKRERERASQLMIRKQARIIRDEEKKDEAGRWRRKGLTNIK